MAGANLKYKPIKKAFVKFVGLLGQKKMSQFTGLSNRVCYKAGAPVNNEAADAPVGVGDVCFDSTNGDAYVCLTYTNPTTHTWANLTP